MPHPPRDRSPGQLPLALRAFAVAALLALSLVLADGGHLPASSADRWTPTPGTTRGAGDALCERARTDAGERPAACTGVRSTTPAAQRPAGPRRSSASALAA